MHEKLACLYCMKNNNVFTLTNGDKAFFFYCHQQFLPTDHKHIKDFFVGKVEMNVAPLL